MYLTTNIIGIKQKKKQNKILFQQKIHMVSEFKTPNFINRVDKFMLYLCKIQ